MIPVTVNNFIITMAVCLLAMGMISMGAGIFVLVSRVLGEDLRTIASQVAQLAKKGIAEDVAGLVGNASQLVDALTQMVKTTSGLGIFLILLGFILVLSAYYLVLQLK